MPTSPPSLSASVLQLWRQLGGQDVPFPANTLRSTYVQHPKRDYVIQWNLNVQQQLTPTLAAMVAYVGSRGVHQPFRVDEADLVIPTKTQYGYLWPQVDVNGNLTIRPRMPAATLPTPSTRTSAQFAPCFTRDTLTTTPLKRSWPSA